ncbi:MAG: protein kinase domain-containing protein [Ktedonobacteraceae bacterium]
MPGLEGQVLGRYELRHLIGRGGMADVYEGYDSHFDRVVAVKVFKREDEEMLRRFIREARLMASFRNPHLVQVYDTGSSQVNGDTRYYIVMPFMEGGTLRARIRRSPLPLADACRNLQDIADALDYIHRQGIIHRDIKSSNVLLDANGRCYLSDFGIARTATDATQLTMTGNVLGTVDYVAPELFEENRKADARSDLYSLGVLLFEMVTGQLPFSAENQIALVSMHMNRRPPSPSSISQDISPDVDRVIFKALEKKPELRYASATELAAAFCSAVAARKKAAVDAIVKKPQEDGQRRPGSAGVILPPVLPQVAEGAKLRQSPLSAATETVPFTSPRPASTASRASTTPPVGPLPRVNGQPPAPSRRPRPSHKRAWIVAILALITLLVVLVPSIYVAATQNNNAHNTTGNTGTQTRGATTGTTPSLTPTATPNLTATAQAQLTATAFAHAHATATAIAGATATVEAQASATAGVLPTATGGAPVYQDHLNNVNNPATQAAQWSGLDGSDSQCSFQKDGYHVTEGVNLVNFHGCNETSKKYQNATLVVDIKLLSGHSGGLFFRLRTDAFNAFSGYLFEVDSKGNYKISVVASGSATALQPWTLTTALKKGYNVTNTLQVIAQDNTFLFYINGIYLTKLSDSTYNRAGEIGFLATTTDTPADIVYTNLKVYARS